MCGYTLLDATGRPYDSVVPGTVGGHRRGRIYGRLDCPSALRAIARGGYTPHRVFFSDEATARLAGYRPCSVCMPERYEEWKRTALLSAAEIATVLRLLAALQPPAVSIVVGSSRDAPAQAAADILARAWADRDGFVLDVVDWPERAASWLRQARRFTLPAPDAWVVTGQLRGWWLMGHRLAHSTDWDPARTIATASLAPTGMAAGDLAADATFDGLRGATADGGIWEITDRRLVQHTASHHIPGHDIEEQGRRR